MGGLLRIDVDGRPATVEQLAVPALVNYGHFTAMQVRGGRVRGLDLHLARLDGATRELFGAGLDGELVREYVRHAVGPAGDGSVRIAIFWPDGAGGPSVLVAVRPPEDAPRTPQRLRTAVYQRPVAHVKHVGTFGQIYFGRRAASAGFDDALLTGPDGVIAEGGITNVGFFDDAGVVWPDAPALPGITMQLVSARLAAEGLRSRRATVRVADLPSFRGAFVTNSVGIGPVGGVDDLELPPALDRIQTVTRLYESVPWDVI